uniref:Centromere protein I-like n=1 Tax=Saccoglossus kowalevskii TaxID=10224 RepID=A0ABM0LUC8_SACKO|nr:PREDICTED: centromere protein I-like [Saccoglossus kowalevskii]
MPLTENDQQKQQASKSGNGKKKTLVALRNAITYFTDARSSAKYRGNLNLHLALENIEQSSRSSGLTPPHILKLVKSITTGKWTEIVSSRLIRSLIPAAHVPHNAVVFAVSSLSAKNISDNMKCLFVRWMVLIYEYVDNKDTLHSLYGILFLFLDSDILCVHICRLLYLMTQRGDVKQYRVRKLLDIQSKVGVQPHIMALLSVYKLYSPNMVTVSSRIGNQSYFKQSDQKWAQIIHLVQEKNKRLNEDEDEAEDANEPSSRALDVHQPRKRRKLDVIPVLETIDRNERVPQSVKSLRKRMVPLEQIENFKQLLQNIDVVVLPNRIASILQSPHLYHVLTLFPDKTIAPRLSYWIHVSLYREIIAYPKSGENPKATALLQVITDFTDHLQVS